MIDPALACTCHPDDQPSGDCRRKYAASDCQKSITQMIDRTKRSVTMLPNEGIAKPGTSLREWADAFTAARTITTGPAKVSA